MPYTIVTGETIEILIEKINLLQGQGWYTQGGVSYSPKDNLYNLSQVFSNELVELKTIGVGG